MDGRREVAAIKRGLYRHPPQTLLLSKIDDSFGSGRAQAGKAVVVLLRQASCGLSDLRFGDGFLFPW